MSDFIIHIGTHKTGSTSIQKFLLDNEAYLRANGLAFLPGLNGKPNFKVLFHAACAPHRRRLMMLRQPNVFQRFFLGRRIRRHLAAACRSNPGKTIVTSTELLSLLREPGEIETLRSLFPAESRLSVAVCLRAKAGFLASMKRQMTAQKTAESGVNGRSNYVNDDSWLVDYEALLAAFRLLSPDVRIVDYEPAAKKGANIILPFLEALGVADLPPADRLPFLNKRSNEP